MKKATHQLGWVAFIYGYKIGGIHLALFVEKGFSNLNKIIIGIVVLIAIKQALEGEDFKSHLPMSAGSIIGYIIGCLVCCPC